jgi:hypothetical protein
VFSYNHSAQYVARVLSIMQAYLDGDFTQVADGLPVSTFIPAKTQPSTPRRPGVGPRHLGSARPNSPNAPSTDHPGTHNPAGPGSNDPGSNPGSGDPSPTNPTASTQAPSTPSVPDPGSTVEEVVLTVQQARAKCVDKLSQFEPLTTGTMISECTSVITGLTDDEAASKLVGGTLAQVLTNLGLSNLIPSLPVGGLPTISLPGS